MRKINYLFILILFLGINTLFAQKSQGIGTNTPNPRAVLDINVEVPSTYPQGLLLPRLTTVERTALGAVAGLATGMAVYDTTDKNFYTWDGTAWKSTGSIVNTIVGIGGIVVSNVGGNFTVSGGSNWTKVGNDINYALGNVGVGNFAASNAKFRVANTGTLNNIGAVIDLNGFTGAGSLMVGVQSQVTSNAKDITGFVSNLNLNNSSVGAIGIEVSINNIAFGAGSNKFAFKSNYPSPLGSANRYGLYIENETSNYLSNNLGIGGINTGTSILEVFGQVTANAGYRTGVGLVNGGNQASFEFVGANEILLKTGASTPRFHISNTGIASFMGSNFILDGGLQIRNLSTTGSVLTVDGLGNVGMGTIAASTNYFTISGSNIYPLSNANTISIGTNTGLTTNSKLSISSNGTAILGNDAAIVVGGLPSFTNAILMPIRDNGNKGWQLNASGGNQENFTVSDATRSNGTFSVLTSANEVQTGNRLFVGVGNVMNTTLTSTAMLDVNGGARIRALSITGSVLTVDGLGNVGMGVMGSSQWTTTTSGIYYPNKVAIGSVINPAEAFQVEDVSSQLVYGSGNLRVGAKAGSGFEGLVSLRGDGAQPWYLEGNYASNPSNPSGFNIRSGISSLSGINIFNIDVNGRVGIGTAAPTSPLHVQAPLNTSIIGMFVGNTSAGSPVNIRVRNNGGGGSALALEYGAGNLFAMTSNTSNEFALYSTVANKEFVNYAPTTERLQISNSSGSVVINASATGIGVQTFTGNEALRIGGFNPSSPKGLVFPYVTTAQMVVLTAQLGTLDAGMAFFNPQTKNVEIWDGTQWQGKGDNGGGNDQYNWNVGGNTITGFSFVTMTGYGKIGTNENFPVAITTGNQPRIFVNTTGGVGIGFASNIMKSTLQVNGDVGLGDGTETGNKPVVVWLKNSTTSGAQGDIVIVGANDDTFTVTNVAGNNSAIGVLIEPCTQTTTPCKVAVAGVVNVNVTGGAVRGQHCVTSASPGLAVSTPTPSPGASIGVFLQTVGAGSPARVLLR